jgi:hypothetical protein
VLLQFILSITQFILAGVTLFSLIAIKVLSNKYEQGADIPLKEAYDKVNNLTAIIGLIWLMMFYLGFRYLWPTAQLGNHRNQTIIMSTLAVIVLILSFIRDYIIKTSLFEHITTHQNYWGTTRQQNYDLILSGNPIWILVAPTLFLILNVYVRNKFDRARFANPVA